ncbi:MAG TPA: glycosyltransferase, partial [Pyrinomonadaceae bacterium]|nr:glycosyltransferase [Pyrinomonadaceae bacterium]
IISSRVGGQPEAIRDNVNGFLCEPDRLEQFVERVEQLAQDDDLRRRLSTEARKIAIEEFDNEIYTTRLIAYYNRVRRTANR